MNDQLLLPPTIAAGDNLLGVMSKASRDNGYLDLSILMRGAGIKVFNAEWDRNLRPIITGQADLERLATLFGQSVPSLNALAYPPAAPGTRWKTHVYRGHRVPWSALSPVRVRYCPACLAEDSSYHYLWDLSWYVACDKHQLLLVDGCTHRECSGKLDWNWNLQPSCSSCGHERTARSVSPDCAAVELSGQLRLLVEGDLTENPDRPWNSLCELLELFEVLAPIALPRSVLGRFDFSPQLWSQDELLTLINLTWPMLKGRQMCVFKMGQVLAGRRHTYPSLPTTACSQRLRMAISEARQPAGEWLAARLEEAELEPGSVGIPPPEQEFATMAMAADLLGTSAHNVKNLIEEGLLIAERAFNGRKLAEWLIPLERLNTLYHDFRTRSGGGTAPPLGSAPLEAVGRSPPGCAEGGFSGLVAGVLAGRLACDKLTPGTSIGQAKISLPPRPATPGSGGLVVSELVAVLGIYANAIYRLMQSGLLPYSMGKRGNWSQRAVSRAQLDTFVSTYAPVTSLARELRVNPTNLSDRLMDAGLIPVSGPKIDGGLIYVFRRSDIASVNMKAILARPSYKSRAGRPRKQDTIAAPADILDATAAAAALEVSVQELGCLARHKILVAHTQSYVKGNKRFFSKETIDAYRLRYADNPNFLSADSAAERLGCSRRQLMVRYVQSGRLELIKDPLLRGYLWRAEVDDLMASLLNEATLSDCARRLGVRPSVLANLRRDKRIQGRRAADARVLIYNVEEVRAVLKERDERRRT